MVHVIQESANVLRDEVTLQRPRRICITDSESKVGHVAEHHAFVDERLRHHNGCAVDDELHSAEQFQHEARGRHDDVCTPRVRDPDIEEEPVIDFNSGYVLRGLDSLPRQGSKTPWRLHQNYVKDLSMMRYGRVEDGTMEFRSAPATVILEGANVAGT